LSSLPRLGVRHPALSLGAERRAARRELAAVDVRPLDPERPFALFSGGNQQKIVIAKWLRTNPGVMLLDDPTQGVDVGARAGIHDLIRERAQQGTSFLIASSDEEELAELCDRVLVMRDGVLAAELVGSDITEDSIVRMSLLSNQPRKAG
jgi:ABC-type sugar transport system ATPase subunit